MSFLFKSKQKGANANALPVATRDLRSSDGPASQIPGLNGIVNTTKPASPTPTGTSANTSLNSLAGNGNSLKSMQQDEKAGYYQPENTLRDAGPPSPERQAPRGQDQQVRNLPVQANRPPPAESPYPWSQRRLTFPSSHLNPFPRYGAAANSTSSKEGAIYLMGGLINGSTVKGDLWTVEAGNGTMTCSQVATTSEGPGPRVGHASLLVGNAFIVFGGDTKMDEGDQLDDALYLLNTSTKQWSRALPAGQRPPGRYGHTLNIVGSKIYIFGGQVEGYFFNDLISFDLNALQQATNKWEMLIQNTIYGGPPHGQIPPARTNHTMITYGDKLYLFGGTDGVHWFNDVWAYTPQSNTWAQLECIGYIPSPREGHSAALVGDVMYIFGGRTEEGTDLGDLAAFRISSRRWYTFQNMGLSPSPRSGHSMTTVGKSIIVVGGEPSTAPRDPVELGMAYFLDTTKIRYPPDSTSSTPSGNRLENGSQRPSVERTRGPGNQAMIGSADARSRSDSTSRIPRAASAQGQNSHGIASAPAGPPPPHSLPQPKANGLPASRLPTRTEDRAFSSSLDMDRSQFYDANGAPSPAPGARDSPAQHDETRGLTSPTFSPNGTTFFDGTGTNPVDEARHYKPETYHNSHAPVRDQQERATSRSEQRSRQRSRNENREPDRFEETPRPSVDIDNFPKVHQVQMEEKKFAPQDSGIGSSPAPAHQMDELVRELESVRQRNAWYASELALARKSGYNSRPADSPVMDDRAVDQVADEDKPLIEALLKMRAELARVQETIDEQTRSAAERIADMEKQRDSAINEAVFAKAKLAGHAGPQDADGKRSLVDGPDRSSDMSRKLASSLDAQRELSRRVDSLIQELASEKKARQNAEEITGAAEKRIAELEAFKQQHTSEVDRLRSELHEIERQHRDLAASHSEISAQHKMLTLDKSELDGHLERALGDSKTHVAALASVREALLASTQKSDFLEQKLEEERGERNLLEQKHRQLKSEHEDATGELEGANKRLRDAEETASKHAEEARTHRAAVLAGLGGVSERSLQTYSVSDERTTMLQQQLESANALVRQNQTAADLASEKLRRAEERIAGLEAYQEQASREGLSIRKQLQAMMKERQSLATEKAELEQKYQSQMLETNALTVQHSSLKDILAERGMSASEFRRSRIMDSPNSLTNRFPTPDQHRVKELEQQLESSVKSQDEMKSHFEEATERDARMKREYEEKLTALDNDHQAAVKYLRGTEKMLSKMKQELQRVKNENSELKKRTDKLRDETSRDGTPSTPIRSDEWEQERDKLRKEVEDVQANLKTSVASLEGQIATMQEQLRHTETQLSDTKSAHETATTQLGSLQSTHENTRADVDRLQQENSALEQRAKDAESKVQLLLDQVEHSVDNYRRQSRIVSQSGNANATPTMNGVFHSRNLSDSSTATPNQASSYLGHARNLSAGNDSLYSAAATEDGHADSRDSIALDSLATELDALRSHWETTNKTYRLSDKFDFEQSHQRTPLASHAPSASGVSAASASSGFGGGSLASWRQGLDIGDEDDSSRPTTAGRDGHDSSEARTPTASTMMEKMT
ncbi:Hypothetical protein R9X50_00446300 [Acrodontium crateriforme]|uniref:Cell polarity protein n=1 Tax=Acrodontium crateriforme TaxID=150365 RepID=A0AAQ3M5D6_9PEZI|nr:Hypothetical protein R9X50_00446300 [Acrodontium crateriforme]